MLCQLWIQELKRRVEKKFVKRVSSAIMKQILEREENKNRKGSINIEERKSDSGNNLDGEEWNESLEENTEHKKEEENNKTEEEEEEKNETEEKENEETQLIDTLLEETLEYLMEMKKKSNKINAFINKCKELIIAIHNYMMYSKEYRYKNDYDEHSRKVEEILTVCKELQKKGYPSNLFFFIRKIFVKETKFIPEIPIAYNK